MTKLFSSSTLKLFAITFMLLDHIGLTGAYDLLGLSSEQAYLPLRIIGRLAFPIFAFLVAEGYFYTRNKNAYLSRLFIFALISEIPFDLAFHNKVLEFSSQNVFFTLTLGLLSIMMYDKYKSIDKTFASLFVLIILIISILFLTDYHAFGVIMIFFFYYFRGHLLMISLNVLFVNLLMVLLSLGSEIMFTDFVQLFAVLSIPILILYNNQKGKNLKYFFYLFYPIHLLMLYFINIYKN